MTNSVDAKCPECPNTKTTVDCGDSGKSKEINIMKKNNLKDITLLREMQKKKGKLHNHQRRQGYPYGCMIHASQVKTIILQLQVTKNHKEINH